MKCTALIKMFVLIFLILLLNALFVLKNKRSKNKPPDLILEVGRVLAYLRPGLKEWGST